jgi:hypothetical protein
VVLQSKLGTDSELTTANAQVYWTLFPASSKGYYPTELNFSWQQD